MTEQKQIEEFKRDIKKALEFDCSKGKCKTCKHKNEDNCEIPLITDYLIEQGYRKLPEDSVVLSREEYEMLKSLYDTQKGAIMTSSIGDLPLTIGGLRKAVDEITRLNRVETELQKLTAKYYNEAKDLRRELKQTRKETAKEIFQKVVNICRKEEDFQDGTINTQLEPLYFGIMNGCAFIRGEVKELAEQYGVEVEE